MKKIEATNGKHSYSCLMAGFPSDLQEEVLEWSFKNVPEEILYTEEDGFGRELDTHTTVKYGLITEDEKEVFSKMTMEPIKFKLGKTFLFDTNPDFDVLVLHIDSPKLIEENKEVSKLENEDSHPKYIPHATLAYIKKGTGKDLVDKQIVDPEKEYNFYSLIFSNKSNEKITKPFNKKASSSILNVLKPLPTLWYENEDGSKKYIPDMSKYEGWDEKEITDKVGNGWTQISLNPQVTESLCTKDGHLGDFNKSINCIELIVMCLVKDYGWRMIDAIVLGATSCERCLNILIEECGGEKYDPKQKESVHTHCELCKTIDPEYDKYYNSGAWKSNLPNVELDKKVEPPLVTAAFIGKAIRRFSAMEPKNDRDFFPGEWIEYKDSAEHNMVSIIADYIKDQTGVIEGYELANGDIIKDVDVIRKLTPTEIEKMEDEEAPEDIAQLDLDDIVDYVDPKDDKKYKTSNIAEINKETNEVLMYNGDIINFSKILSIRKEEPPKMQGWTRKKQEQAEKYDDIWDIPTMKPRERQQKIDNLLDKLNEEKDPEKKKQIEEQLKSLKASLKLFKGIDRKALLSTDNLVLDHTSLPLPVEVQILRLAMVAELDAISLYEQMAATVKDGRVKKILMDVAKEEKTHVGEFDALLREMDPQYQEELSNGTAEVQEKTMPAMEAQVPQVMAFAKKSKLNYDELWWDKRDKNNKPFPLQQIYDRFESDYDIEDTSEEAFIEWLETFSDVYEKYPGTKKKSPEKSSWSVDKKHNKIFRDKKAKIKAELLAYGETYRVKQKVVLATCLGSEEAQIEELLGKGKYVLLLNNGMKVKANKENIFPVGVEDLK